MKTCISLNPSQGFQAFKYQTVYSQYVVHMYIKNVSLIKNMYVYVRYLARYIYYSESPQPIPLTTRK